ncbi:hypothetical protein QA648_05825 [Rhizobium sp. CB3171]|uniref:hypothetical protein n=1 Tax=Rhizobium sp. CB3171 TaxID=3039157 RepID=UPI0024B18463|nr:hypothetical protein [Rhizobium sp. CB3171]WFU03277.1 hypothetical protein QA648_05825 [Rhizobium sp. CB3171]
MGDIGVIATTITATGAIAAGIVAVTMMMMTGDIAATITGTTEASTSNSGNP